MSLNIEAVWSRPLELKLVNSGAIYRCGEIESVPYEPGCYIFGRAYDDYAAPLYIGKALMLRRRIEQQLDSVRLMTGIREAQKGGRFVIYCTPLLVDLRLFSPPFLSSLARSSIDQVHDNLVIFDTKVQFPHSSPPKANKQTRMLCRPRWPQRNHIFPGLRGLWR
jgi:hypothetical protein